MPPPAQHPAVVEIQGYLPNVRRTQPSLPAQGPASCWQPVQLAGWHAPNWTQAQS